MIITYQGIEYFKVQYGDIVLAFNPVSKQSKHEAARFGADLALVSVNIPECNGIESVTLGDKKPFVISGPGEYEFRGVLVRGFASETTFGGEKRSNTIYLVSLEGMTLCFLGAFAAKQLPKELSEEIEDIDILFVPIGGEGVLGSAEAYEFAVSLEPKLIIPMHYGAVGAKNALQVFLKESGEIVKPTDKLTIKKKDVEGKEGEVVVLTPQH